MGAFNVLVAAVTCPSHDGPVEVPIQFKYGSVRQLTYGLGDRLRWGTNDVGERGAKEVLVDGEAETCPVCGYHGDWPVRIAVNDDVLATAASVAVGTPDLPEGFTIIRR